MVQEMANSPYQSPLYTFGDSVIGLTSTDQELERLELNLKGFKLDENGNNVRYGRPLLNERGVSTIIGIVQSLYNKGTVMSNFNKYDIPMILEFLGDTLAKNLMLNKNAFGIDDVSVRDQVYFMVLGSVWSTLKRALEEGHRRFLGRAAHEITTRVDTGGQSSSPSLRNFLGWSKG